jgi:hypothetical protein
MTMKTVTNMVLEREGLKPEFSLVGLVIEPMSHCSGLRPGLKVPKREDFPVFYTIKSLRVGDFEVKIKNKFKNI